MSRYSMRNYYGDVKEKEKKPIILTICVINSNLMRLNFKKWS